MPKRIKLELLETDVTAVAELQETHAPKTCEALWEALSQPLEGKVIHAMYAGREVFMNMPEANRTFDPTAIPRENATAYPLPGDIAWAYFEPHAERGGFPPVDEDGGSDGFWDLAFVYGPEVTFDSSLGIRPIGVWACITEGLVPFAEECARIRTHDGPKTLRIERLEAEAQEVPSTRELDAVPQ